MPRRNTKTLVSLSICHCYIATMSRVKFISKEGCFWANPTRRLRAICLLAVVLTDSWEKLAHRVCPFL